MKELQIHVEHGQYHEEVGERECQALAYEQHEDGEVQEVGGQGSQDGQACSCHKEGSEAHSLDHGVEGDSLHEDVDEDNLASLVCMLLEHHNVGLV